ncbi:putative peptidoglycan biosynthesis protein MviN [Cellulomonas hominis]|nr:putative peptidoglycan biosynthesis protein MviN [Cellulomonas hominis]
MAGITSVSDDRTDEPSAVTSDGSVPSDATVPSGGGPTAPAPTAVVPTPVRRTSSAFGRTAAAGSAATTPAAGTASTDRPEAFLPEEVAPEEQPDDAPVSPAAGDAGDGPSRPDWDLPFPSERPADSVTERRFDPTRWVLGLVALAVVVGVVVALANVLSPFGSGDDDAGAAATQAPVATAPPAEQPAEGEGDAAGEAPAAVPPVIAGVTTIDPSDGDGEHEELVGRLVDGDPATTWYTHTYNRPDFAGFKDAVGLVITLQAPATVTSVTLDVNGSGGNVEVRSTDAANPTAGDVLAAGALAPQTVLTLAQPTETQSLVLWFTSLSQTPDGQNRIEISNVAVS